MTFSLRRQPIKAKNIQLDTLRVARQKEFENLGFPMRLHLDLEKAILPIEVQAELKRLRDATEPLKAPAVSGLNDEIQLNKIRQLGDPSVLKNKQ